MQNRVNIRYNFVESQKDIPDYTPPTLTTGISPTTLKIDFLSLNDLLQQHFYKICYPVTLLQLSLILPMIEAVKRSTCISTRTDISRHTNFDLPGKPSEVSVVEIRGFLSLDRLHVGEVSKYFPDHIFNHNTLRISDCELNTEELKTVCYRNVTKFTYVDRLEKKETFKTCLEGMPYLREFQYMVENDISNMKSTMLNWEQKSKLISLKITCGWESINNLIRSLNSLKEFMEKQEENFVMELKYRSIHDLPLPDNFFNYFDAVDSQTADGKNLNFTRYEAENHHWYKLKNE